MSKTCIYGRSNHEPKKTNKSSCGHSHGLSLGEDEHHHEHSHSCKNHKEEHHHEHDEHNHEHGHSHHIHTKNKKMLFYSCIVTAIVMMIELFYGYLSNSLALISDALHMLMHAFALLLSYVAVIASKFENKQKTFGFYRAEIIAAFVNAVLIALLTIFIVWEAIEKLLNPEEIEIKTMLVVSAFGLIVNIITALLLMRADLNNINIKSSFFHMLGDLLSSVAIVIGGIVVYYTNWYFIDTILALLIALVIAKWSFGLFKQSLDILLEASPVDIEKVRNFVLEKHQDEIADIHDIHIVSIAQDYHVLTAHILIAKDKIQDFKGLISNLSHSLEKRFNITHITIQPEWKEC